LLIPVFLIVFTSSSWNSTLLPAVIFSIAALTDLLDGYLARRNDQITNLGRLLDPIADKLLVLAGLILLVQFNRVEAWLAIAIMAREIAVGGLRSIAAAEGMIISADTLGKYKAFLQVIGIICLTLPASFVLPHLDMYSIGTTILYMSLVLGIFSGIQYGLRALEALSPNYSQKRPTSS
jgi:CDP-diacylglycerol--glycerol-3-phosphate 3-phosphatidyltransferase